MTNPRETRANPIKRQSPEIFYGKIHLLGLFK